MPTHAFLGSASLAAVPDWLDGLPRRPATAVVVPADGNRLKSSPWVGTTITQLEDCGVTVTVLDLETTERADILTAVNATDLIWVTGGHPIFLLQHAQASGFLSLVRTGVLDGALYYAGISAGAALATPTWPATAVPTIPASSTTPPAWPSSTATRSSTPIAAASSATPT